MTWNSTPVPSEVEFTFAALGPAGEVQAGSRAGRS
jgi:hypothetical protein